jgi:hypothetical protein
MARPTDEASKAKNQGSSRIPTADELEIGVSSAVLARQVYSCKPDSEIVRRGQESQRHLDLQKSQDWGHYMNICLALCEIRNSSMAAVGVAKPRGRRYGEFLDHALRIRGFGRYAGPQHKSLLSQLIKVAENLNEINAWRCTLPEKQQIGLNGPLVVLRHWEAEQKQQHQDHHPHDHESGQDHDHDRGPVNPALEGFSKSTDAQVTEALRIKGLPWSLERIPDEWRPKLEALAGRQFLSRAKLQHPNKKLKYLNIRLVHNADAQDSNTKPATH